MEQNGKKQEEEEKRQTHGKRAAPEEDGYSPQGA
jgi:hypothetical protein